VEPLVAQNQLVIARYDAFWNRVVLGLIEPGPRKRIYLLLIAGTLISLAFGSWLATRESSSAAVTARFMILTAAFVIIVGNALERDENHRFRTYLAPFTIAFLALGATRLGESRLAKTRRAENS
jgi:drug/metabolite transporter (DMT)-like permease